MARMGSHSSVHKNVLGGAATSEGQLAKTKLRHFGILFFFVQPHHPPIRASPKPLHSTSLANTTAAESKKSNTRENDCFVFYYDKYNTNSLEQSKSRTWMSKPGHIDRSSSTFFKTLESKVCPPNPGCTARTSTQCSSRRGLRRGNTTETGVSGLRATPARMPALVICRAFRGIDNRRAGRGGVGGSSQRDDQNITRGGTGGYDSRPPPTSLRARSR